MRVAIVPAYRLRGWESTLDDRGNLDGLWEEKEVEGDQGEDTEK